MTETFELSESTLVKYRGAGDPQMILLHGPAGVGKTWVAASASEVEGLYPMLFIDTEGSTQGTLNGFDHSPIDIVRPQETHSGNEYAMVVSLLESLLKKDHKYKTVVIDTADVLQDWSLSAGKKAGDGFAHWNFTHSELTAPPTKHDRGLFHRLKAAKFLTILIVHDKVEALNEEGTLTYANVQWSGKGKEQLPGIPDAVLFITRDTNSAGVSKTTILTQPNKRALAKNRYGLPHKMENASLSTIYDTIRNNTKEDK